MKTDYKSLYCKILSWFSCLAKHNLNWFATIYIYTHTHIRICVYIYIFFVVLVAQSCLTLCDPMVCPWNPPGKNTGVGCHSFLQGIFLAQGSNLGLLHHRQFLYHLSYQGSPIYSLVILFNMNVHMLCWRNIRVSDYGVLSQTLLRLLI